jgi:hypothetical protein
MPKFSGSFSAKLASLTALSLDDVPNHELRIATINGLQKTTDENWKDSHLTYWDASDLVAGNGTHHGYFVDVHPNGDRDIGTFEGKVKTSGEHVTIEGKWKYTDGTGQFKGITGGGTYKGRMTSPTEVENTWEGSYELAGKKARVA